LSVAAAAVAAARLLQHHLCECCEACIARWASAHEKLFLHNVIPPPPSLRAALHVNSAFGDRVETSRLSHCC